jgi:site-specific recombinase XerD
MEVLIMEEQKQTISELIDMATTELVRLQYSPFTVENYQRVWKNLLRYADVKDTLYFSEAFGERFLRDHYGYEHGYLERNYRKVNPPRIIEVLGHFQLHGVIMHQRLDNRKMKPPEIYAPLLAKFAEHLRKMGMKEASVENLHRNVVRFTEYLHANEVLQIEKVTGVHIAGFASTLCGYSSGGIQAYFYAVRNFLRFLHENNYHKDDLTGTIPKCLNRPTQFLPFIWKDEDVKKLLAAVDRANPIGKRNYAVLLLVIQLGLRDSDIQNLKLDNIKWERSCIEIVQVKTGKQVALPLLDDLGMAIIDYLKYGRPKSNLPNVFLKHVPPYDRMHDFTSVVYKYINLAGIEVSSGSAHGMHSLRHTMATRLLENSVPLSTISGILGHVDLNSASVYLSVDVANLKKCALDPEEVFVCENA